MVLRFCSSNILKDFFSKCIVQDEDALMQAPGIDDYRLSSSGDYASFSDPAHLAA